MKVEIRKLSKEERIKYLDALYTTVATLKSRDEVKLFLRDLLTESERIMVGRRILIAQKLLADKSYDEIAGEMRVGMDTITRVHRWLEDEASGYEKAITALNKEMGNRLKFKKESAPVPYSFSWLKKKYPLHFALFNLFDKK